MAEYIDKEEIMQRWSSMAAPASLVSLTAAISQCDVVDLVPVARGEWILRHEGFGHYWECSVCHTNPCIYVTEHTKFCPNCGARMDEKAEKFWKSSEEKRCRK